MPTGYTYRVEEGEITTLEEFALLCARAFGGFVHMRDDSMDAPLRRRDYDNGYHTKGLPMALKELQELQDLTLEELEQKVTAHNDAHQREYREARKNYELASARYFNLLGQVRGWMPSPSILPLQKFMIEQLATSLDSLYEPKPYVPLSSKGYLKQHLERINWSISWHKEQIEKEQEREKEMNTWVDELFTSLNLPLLPK